jgi:hypothetical protein
MILAIKITILLNTGENNHKSAEFRAMFMHDCREMSLFSGRLYR